MLKSQVDDFGRHLSFVKYIDGCDEKPVAGSFDDPEKKWRTSLIFTSPLSAYTT